MHFMALLPLFLLAFSDSPHVARKPCDQKDKVLILRTAPHVMWSMVHIICVQLKELMTTIDVLSAYPAVERAGTLPFLFPSTLEQQADTFKAHLLQELDGFIRHNSTTIYHHGMGWIVDSFSLIRSVSL